MLLYGLCVVGVDDFLGLGFMRELVFDVVNCMEGDKVVSVVEDEFFHEMGWGWVIVVVI